MKVLRAIYTRSHSLASLAIRAAAWGGPWSHCGLIAGDAVIESRASAGGVTIGPLDAVIQRSSASEIVDIKCPDPDAAIAWALSTVGLPYDYGGVLGIPFRERDWQRPGRWYCSEHLERALVAGGRVRFRAGLHGISPSQSYFVR